MTFFSALERKWLIFLEMLLKWNDSWFWICFGSVISGFVNAFEMK